MVLLTKIKVREHRELNSAYEDIQNYYLYSPPPSRKIVEINFLISNLLHLYIRNMENFTLFEFYVKLHLLF